MAKKNRSADSTVSDSELRLEEDTSLLTELDPKLQSLLLAVKSGEQPESALVHAGDQGELMVEVLAVLRDPTAQVPGFHVSHLIGDVATGTVEVGDIEAVRQDTNVISLKAAQRVQAELHVSVPEIRASRPALDAVGAGIDGAGVIVGIVDFGCDVAHRDFLNPDGTTRIRFLWDQNARLNTMSPGGFSYGREFTAADINAALSTPDPYQHLSYDPGTQAHGTHVMGIAAGNGRGSGVPGVAPKADIIFVELAGTDTSIDESFGNSKQLLEAVSYIFEKASQLGRPAVVNLSLGTHGGPHDGSTPAERGFDHLLSVPGRAIVISAGNSFERRSHASGVVGGSQPRTLRWEKFATDQTANELEIWYGGTTPLSVALVSPGGTRLGPVAQGTTTVIRSGALEVGRIIHRKSDPLNGDHQIDLILGRQLPAGIWRVELAAPSASGVPFHAWIERDDDRRDPTNPLKRFLNQSKFVGEDTDTTHTLGSISCGARTIVVGSYQPGVMRRDLSAFSSSGPTRDGRQKPEISAPGDGIRAPASGTGTGVVPFSGTSMAAPHVAGVIALTMQAAAAPLSVEDIRSALRTTARTAPQPQSSWDARYGFGRIDAAAAVGSQLDERAPVAVVRRPPAHPEVLAAPSYHPLLEHLVTSLVDDVKSRRVRVRFEVEVEPAAARGTPIAS